jgi:HEAT repeat protein
MAFFGIPDIEKMVAENDFDGLYHCLTHQNKLVRFQAAQALADLNDGVGWRFLLDAIRDAKDPEGQTIAADMLGELGDHRAIPYLGEALRKARGTTAETIRNALETMPGPEADQALRLAGYEPVIPKLSGNVIEYSTHYARPVVPNTNEIQYRSAEEHLNTAVELRESEMAEHGLVQVSLALWLSPDWAYAWYLRGVLFEDLDRPFEAFLAYQHALAMDPAMSDAKEAFEELEDDFSSILADPANFEQDLSERSWEKRRDAAAGLGALVLQGESISPSIVDRLIKLLQDEEREVRIAAITTLGLSKNDTAAAPLLEAEESSWLARFSIIQALAQIGSIDGLAAVLHKEMERVQRRNPLFSSNKDPLLEVEYDLLMEIGARAFEITGDLDALLTIAEGNSWVEQPDDPEEAENDASDSAFDFEADEEVDEDLSSYVDEVALMVSSALDRLATPQIPHLSIETLERLAALPDLTLIDLSVPEEDTELSEDTEEDTAAIDQEAAEPVIVYDFSELRKAAQNELDLR